VETVRDNLLGLERANPPGNTMTRKMKFAG